MQLRNIIIGAIALLCLFVMFKVMMDAQASDEVEVDSVALQKALAEYKRDKTSVGTSSPSVPDKVARSKVRSVLPKKESSAKRDKENSVKSTVAPSLMVPAGSIAAQVAENGDRRAQMSEANKMYDRSDYEGARESAMAILEDDPENVRMLRIVVSSSCIMGDAELARKPFHSLPKRDQQQMSRRCKRYGIEFDD